MGKEELLKALVEPYPNVKIERELRKKFRKNPKKLSTKELLILILSELQELNSKRGR